jgi:AraC-like DNA-binding protein
MSSEAPPSEGVTAVSTVESPPVNRLGADDLGAEVLAITPDVGPNATRWPGLTAYRFTRPQASQWAEVQSLALCCVVQGCKRLVVDDREYVCDPHHYLLFARGMRFETEILEASVDAPYLSFVLQIDPALVSSVLVDLVARAPASSTRPTTQAAVPAAHVSAFDQDLGEVVVRFLRSLASTGDRRVLAPLYLREITYRLMQADQASRLLHAAASERDRNPVSEVIGYIRDHLSEPITVADMARHVLMSASALTSVFVDATGVGPYRFAKRMRLNRASVLLIQGDLNVSEVAREVGYASVSYFINEFKRQFGTTPRAYAHAQRSIVALRIDEATSPRPAESATHAPPPRHV